MASSFYTWLAIKANTDGAWKLQYLVVDMHKLFRDRQVFVKVGNFRKELWSNAEIYANIARTAIKNSLTYP
jgi:hypothetical protein